MKIRSVEAAMIRAARRTEGQTETTKLLRFFARNAKGPKKSEGGGSRTNNNKNILKTRKIILETEWGPSKLPASAFIVQKFAMKADIKRTLLCWSYRRNGTLFPL
jgi:hypothetical protein